MTKRLCAVAAIMALAAACSADPAAPAKSANRLEAKCHITFEVADKWKAKPVEPSGDSLAEAAGLKLCYEIDAKGAGLLGFIRVWSGDDPNADVRQTLEAFLAEEGKKGAQHEYSQTKAGTTEVVEAVSATKEAKDKGFAVATPKGIVAVLWRGLDDEEFEDGMAAYDLAKSTLKVE
ncbi:hypothetical protein [Alloactinosynnema sp. L-07]|uniref:lipoprotein n=1 Tax=Alloactinosynnema sp. L-07 TaxID=1653480 RepID=UPI00065EF704|nr:lipoprotein [Alloactinosynnema sp. L-07]CRK60474.1 hypothetical protein [Alloactinosynnema sp. L-07]